MTDVIMFDRVAIIGIGLIGSSLALALRKFGLAGHIAGAARSQATRDKAVELGLVDSVHKDPGDAVTDADLTVVCAPVGANPELAPLIGPHLKKGSILSDVGSVKQAVIRDFGPYLPEGVHFVPGHPVAGTEHSGPEAGFAEMFERRWCILTPPPGTDQAAVAKLSDMWQRVGMMVDIMDAVHHDRVLAITSHLPHLIAYTITGTVFDLEGQLRREALHLDEAINRTEVIKFSAGGFRDFTRIAASDPVMWRDVFLNNREAVLEMLGRFTEDLASLQRAIRWGEGDKLEDLFHRTRSIRREIIAAHQAGGFSATEPQDEDEKE